MLNMTGSRRDCYHCPLEQQPALPGWTLPLHSPIPLPIVLPPFLPLGRLGCTAATGTANSSVGGSLQFLVSPHQCSCHHSCACGAWAALLPLEPPTVLLELPCSLIRQSPRQVLAAIPATRAAVLQGFHWNR